MCAQQPIGGCAFCETMTGTRFGTAYTWGNDERVSHPICPDCAIQTEPDPDERDHASFVALVEFALVELTHEHVGVVIVTSGTIIK